MTTVEYGDVIPVTGFDKILGACIGVIGMGMVALPAGLLAAGFNSALHRRRREYEEAVEDAVELLETGIRNSGASLYACPHCHKPLYHQPAELKDAE